MKRVLIVDDAAFMRARLKIMLKNKGYKVVGEAENGEVGVRKFLELRPDLVTMDITMPEMDGLQALKMVKSINPNARVVMVTAMGQEQMVREAIELGARGFVIKPFNEESVIKALKKACE